MPESIVSTLGWSEAHPGLASWVQAFFSIIGIGIAIYVPYRQHVRDVKLARQLRLEDRLRAMEAAATIMINAMNLIEDAWKNTAEDENSTEGYFQEVYDASAFDFAARALEEVNVFNIPDWEMIKPVVDMRSLVIQAKHLARKIAEADHYIESDPDLPREALHHVRQKANTHMSNVEAAVNRLRDDISTEKGH